MNALYHLSSAVPADLPLLASIETAAMQSSPLKSVFFHNWASLPTQAATFQVQIASAMATPHVHIVKAVSAATGAIDGFVIWKALERDDCSAGDAESQAAAPSDPPGVEYAYAAAPETLVTPDAAMNMPFCGIAVAATDRLRESLVRGRRCVCRCFAALIY
ncbi:hypothetical protein MMC17_007018 [Xylographa soralifera]|nr:hypothetical protein [Xylographa soralifera]